MTADPAMGFWLRYVEREGGLYEDRGDVALAVLPPRLAEPGLGEAVLVTADPEAAREDGAQLIGPGHPALDQAVDDVLGCGDAGCAALPWPGSSRPGLAALEERARAAVSLARGRLDLAAPLSPCYAPLLRVAALVTYRLSLDQRVQARLRGVGRRPQRPRPRPAAAPDPRTLHAAGPAGRGSLVHHLVVSGRGTADAPRVPAGPSPDALAR